MRKFPAWILMALLCGCVADAPHHPPPIDTRSASGERATAAPEAAATLPDRLASAAPLADPAVLRLALRARDCAVQSGVASADASLGVIDYTRPSTQRRLWIFAMDQPRLLFFDYVAHGRGSGENLARRFSNDDGSLQSSLGLFRTAETYSGENGYSLRLDGLEPGVNDHARPRALVMHGAWYVDPLLGLKQGRIGRSLGCPALRPAVAHAVIDALKQDELLFAYYPDPHWLATSRFLHCTPTAGSS